MLLFLLSGTSLQYRDVKKGALPSPKTGSRTAFIILISRWFDNPLFQSLLLIILSSNISFIILSFDQIFQSQNRTPAAEKPAPNLHKATYWSRDSLCLQTSQKNTHFRSYKFPTLQTEQREHSETTQKSYCLCASLSKSVLCGMTEKARNRKIVYHYITKTHCHHR